MNDRIRLWFDRALIYALDRFAAKLLSEAKIPQTTRSGERAAALRWLLGMREKVNWQELEELRDAVNEVKQLPARNHL